MTPELLQFFSGQPEQVLALYLTLEAVLRNILPAFDTRVQKSQITWQNRHVFGCVSIPRKAAHRPGLTVTFGLGRREADPRIAASVEPHPGRWTHHVLLRDPEDIDPQLLAWLAEAYMFANEK